MSGRDSVIARAQVEAEYHQPEAGGGCTCGFSVWSAEHVLVMSLREVLPHEVSKHTSPDAVWQALAAGDPVAAARAAVAQRDEALKALRGVLAEQMPGAFYDGSACQEARALLALYDHPREARERPRQSTRGGGERGHTGADGTAGHVSPEGRTSADPDASPRPASSGPENADLGGDRAVHRDGVGPHPLAAEIRALLGRPEGGSVSVVQLLPPWCKEHGTRMEWLDGTPLPGYSPTFRPVGWVCPCDPGHTTAHNDSPRPSLMTYERNDR